jgi:hypothetical protein
MPIIDYPFVDILGSPKPALPVVLINPDNGFDYFTWAIIDTGADTTVIPEFIAKSLYHDVKHHTVKRDMHWGIGGEVVAYYHTFRINVLGLDPKGNVDNEKTAVKISRRPFAVIQNLHIMVLGENDFLKKYVLTINYPKKIFSVREPS